MSANQCLAAAAEPLSHNAPRTEAHMWLGANEMVLPARHVVWTSLVLVVTTLAVLALG